MKKTAFILSLLLLLTACGRYEHNSVSTDELGESLLFASKLQNTDRQSLKNSGTAALYGIAPDEIEGGMVYKTPDGKYIIIITKTQSRTYLRNVEYALETQLTALSNAWKYDREESERIKKHILKTRGNYSLMAVTDNSTEVESGFDSMLR